MLKRKPKVGDRVVETMTTIGGKGGGAVSRVEGDYCFYKDYDGLEHQFIWRFKEGLNQHFEIAEEITDE